MKKIKKLYKYYQWKNLPTLIEDKKKIKNILYI